MPNWCENDVMISGTKKDIRELRKWMGNMEFEKMAPTPDELRDRNAWNTACSIPVYLGSDKVCHRTKGKCVEESEQGLTDSELSPNTVSLAQAVMQGYTRCTKCLRKNTIAYPVAESIELFKKYGTDNLEDWRRQNWGTKWEVDQEDLDVDWGDTFVHFHFYTAWTPPEGIYEAIVERFPNLEISWHYSEPGVGFAGNLVTGEEYHYTEF